jgi:uncharacterized protein (TIGR00255 family)
LRSMTGFGRGEARFQNGKITVEIKTINHKFFDATIRLPNNLVTFEEKVKELLQKKIMRGKVSVTIAYDGKPFKTERVTIDRKSAKHYRNELASLARDLGVKSDISVKDIIALPGVLTCETAAGDLAKFWPKIKEAIDNAVDRLVADRQKEGHTLRAELAQRTRRIETMLNVIKGRAHLNIGEYRKRFADRVKDITGGRAIDNGRLEMEVAIFAKNCDISEEITRLKSHLANFMKTIRASGEVGKKIDFIAQELHRETNTIGSKASDFKISKNVIEIKSEIEKIREQAKNLE